ncbi:MAG: NAD-binding protein [Phycisphaerae bacterium]|nr:NAD(P)-binding protein [Tepidisphaeraceae bacterium]
MDTQESTDNATGARGGPPALAAVVAPAGGAAPAPADPPRPDPVVVIVGFGLPGRFVAEVLDARQIPYSVLELNPVNARNVARIGKRVVCGEARNPDLLKEAGIEKAQVLAVTLPDEKAVIEVLNVARQINPSIRMLARVNYTSTGIKAERAGASHVLVEEQLVALEFARLMGNVL